MKSFFKKLWHNIISTITHYGWLSLIIIPILGLINWSYLTVINSEKASLKSQQVSLANEKINIIDFIISNAISNSYNDIKVMSDADEMQVYLENSNPAELESLEQLLYRIINNKPQFSNVEYLSLTGEQIINISRIDDELVIIDEDDLISKANEDYFEVVDNLIKDELYIVPIYIEQELTVNGYIDKPLTSLIITVYNKDDLAKGYLVLEYNTNYLVSIFNEYIDPDSLFIDLGLINEDVLWKITDNLSETFDVDQDIDYLNNPENDNILKSSVKFPNEIEDKIYNGDDFFQIYTVIDFDTALKEYGGIFIKAPYLIFFINLFSLATIIFLAWLLKSKGDDRILLNANMYLSDKNNDGVLITNEMGEISYTNKAFEEIFGYDFIDIKGQKPSKILGNINYGIKGAVMKSKQVFSKNVWNINKKGIFILKHLRIKPETSSNGKIKHFLAIYSSPQIEVDSLAFASNYDAIETYKLFAKAFETEEIKVYKSCFMVIRTFNEKSKKLYNGIKKSNLNPLSFPDFLNEYLPRQFKIAVPLESYTIIYVSLDKIDHDLKETIDMIDNLIEKYKHLPNINNDLEYNFGIALADNKAITRADVIENAFIALQMSKTRKNIKHLIYDDEIKKIIKKEKDIYGQLDHGFTFDEFYMQYQIQKDVINNSYTGVEALLRWKNSSLGNVPPYEFISIIENSFFINRLSIMVVNKVIKDFSSYIEYINPNFKISINLTYFDFFNDYIIHNLVQLIEDSVISTSNFCFEITESGYLENQEKTNQIIDYLHSKNISIAIDDFGTGFSSLEVLKNIHVDKVKIDRSFIKDYPKNDDGGIFKTIVNLVKGMNLGVLVEGTETKEQVDFAVSCGCDEIQGYYISQPIYIENLVRKFMNKKSDF
jgi:PAS domain S-box-containing protein